MSDHKPERTVPERTDVREVAKFILRTATAMDGYTSQTRRALDLNAHERLAVAGLWANGPMTMTELGAWIPLSRAAVTTLVDRLERSGYVSRGSDPGDRRRTVVSVEREALRGVNDVMAPWVAEVAALVQSLDDAQWTTIAGFMQRISELNSRHTSRLTAMSDDEIQSIAQLA